MSKSDEGNPTCGSFFPAVTISFCIHLARSLFFFVHLFVYLLCSFFVLSFPCSFRPFFLPFFVSFRYLYLCLSSLSVSLTTKTIFKLQLTSTSLHFWWRYWMPETTLKGGLKIPFRAFTIALPPCSTFSFTMVIDPTNALLAKMAMRRHHWGTLPFTCPKHHKIHLQTAAHPNSVSLLGKILRAPSYSKRGSVNTVWYTDDSPFGSPPSLSLFLSICHSLCIAVSFF